MSRFLTPLDVELVDDNANKWRLRSPLAYDSDLVGHVIGIPAGFVTDFASVPRIPVAFWLTGDCAHEPAVVHDYLYATCEVPRDMADAVLLEAMEVVGVPAWRRWVIYAGVRVGGWQFYGKRKQAPEGGDEGDLKQIAP